MSEFPACSLYAVGSLSESHRYMWPSFEDEWLGGGSEAQSLVEVLQIGLRLNVDGSAHAFTNLDALTHELLGESLSAKIFVYIQPTNVGRLPAKSGLNYPQIAHYSILHFEEQMARMLVEPVEVLIRYVLLHYENGEPPTDYLI